MALHLVSLEEVSAFTEGGAFASGPIYDRAWDIGATWQSDFYYDRYDRWYFNLTASATFGWCDPLMVDSSDVSKNGIHYTGSGYIQQWAVGQWDKVNDIQQVYGDSNDGFFRLHIMDLATMTSAGFAFGESFGMDKSAGAQTAAGSWFNSTGVVVPFEGWGWAIVPSADWAETGSGGGYDSKIPILVALNSDEIPQGKAKYFEGNSSYYTASGSHESHRPVYGGDTIEYRRIQFVPDDDDSMGQPKGRLFWQSFPITVVAGPPPQIRTYVKIVEFNPTNKAAVSGSPSRTHNRELLHSRITLLGKVSPPNGIGSTDGYAQPPYAPVEAVWADESLIYHPPSNTLRALFTGNSAFTEGDNTLMVMRPAAVLDSNGIVAPTPVAEIETAKVVTWQTHAMGDLGERIPGVDLEWTLRRTSTYGEVLDVSGLTPGAGGACPAVSNFPVTDRTVYQDGVPLTPTTDYTIVLATGVVTLVAPHPVALSVYTIDYGHPEDSAKPAHGTLQTAYSITDELGVGTTRVLYPDDDDLEGEREELVVTSV